jgi:hypothetical protein
LDFWFENKPSGNPASTSAESLFLQLNQRLTEALRQVTIEGQRHVELENKIKALENQAKRFFDTKSFKNILCNALFSLFLHSNNPY